MKNILYFYCSEFSISLRAYKSMTLDRVPLFAEGGGLREQGNILSVFLHCVKI